MLLPAPRARFEPAPITLRWRPLWAAAAVALAACATAQDRARVVTAQYGAVQAAAEVSYESGLRARAEASRAEVEGVRSFPQLDGDRSLKAARQEADRAVAAAHVREGLREARAGIAAGRADQALQLRVKALASEAGLSGQQAELRKVLDEVWTARSPRECAPVVDALLASGAVREAHDRAFGFGLGQGEEPLPCTLQVRARVAQAYVRDLIKANPCTAAIEGLQLAFAAVEQVIDKALAADPGPQLAQALIALARSTPPPACLTEVLAQMGRLRGYAPALLVALAPLPAAIASDRAEERASQQRAGAEGVARLEREGKFAEALAFARVHGDPQTVSRLGKEHPSPLVARLRKRVLELEKKAPFAAAVLQTVARGFGETESTIPEGALMLVRAPVAERRAGPGYVFELNSTGFAGQDKRLLVSNCPDLKDLLGIRLNGYAVRKEGGWVIREASCGRSGGGQTRHSKSKRIEHGKVSREVPSGDGVTTRTVWVDQVTEVETDSTYTLPPDGDYWIELRVAPSKWPDGEVIATASAKDPGECPNCLLDNLRASLYARFKDSEENRVLTTTSKRLGAALKRLEAARDPDAREDALAELAVLKRTGNQDYEQWVVDKYQLPAGAVWPWAGQR